MIQTCGFTFAAVHWNVQGCMGQRRLAVLVGFLEPGRALALSQWGYWDGGVAASCRVCSTGLAQSARPGGRDDLRCVFTEASEQIEIDLVPS